MLRNLIVLAFSVSLAGCSWIESYKTPIQQGRIITQQQINQIKPGMSPAQVQFILGTPGIKDPMHPNTWHYVYTHKMGGYPVTERKLEVTFKNQKLFSISGDYNPPEKLQYQFDEHQKAPAQQTKHTAPKATIGHKTKAPTTQIALKPAPKLSPEKKFEKVMLS